MEAAFPCIVVYRTKKSANKSTPRDESACRRFDPLRNGTDTPRWMSTRFPHLLLAASLLFAMIARAPAAADAPRALADFLAAEWDYTMAHAPHLGLQPG